MRSGLRRAAPRQFQHVFDDAADAFGVVADDLGEPAVLRAVSTRDSASSWPAWLMAPTGVRISCAMLAESRPSAASLNCCTFSVSTLVSSRKMSTGQGRVLPSRAKCGWISREPSAAVNVPVSVRFAMLAPGRQQEQQARRTLAQQRTGPGIGIAEHVRPRVH